MAVLLDATIVQHSVYVRNITSCLVAKVTQVSIQHIEGLTPPPQQTLGEQDFMN